MRLGYDLPLEATQRWIGSFHGATTFHSSTAKYAWMVTPRPALHLQTPLPCGASRVAQNPVPPRQTWTPAPPAPTAAMAFVTALPVARAAPPLRTRATEPLRPATTRMGYGDYSYSTDKTKGHVQQYYVDKFRVASDFGRGSAPTDDGDAVLGRTAKGAALMPTGGVPQPVDPILLADMSGEDADPRVAESEGAVWRWDAGYADPAFAAESFADVESADVADDAFVAFRAASGGERAAALGSFDAALKYKVAKIQAGFSEKYMLTMEGQYEANYARLQKIKDIVMFTPSGQPATELPGFPYLQSIGAMDFQPVAANEVNTAFWKTKDAPSPVVYQKPMGAGAPDLPYNGSPSVEQMKAATKAKGLLPSE